jgi:hypothetical protein
MARYLLLLHRPSSTLSGGSPDELRERIEKYRTWREDMARNGKIVAGEKLTGDPGLLVRKAGGEVLVERPDGDGAQSVVSGYFVLQAEDDREARELASRCPHLDFGGTIELRQIEPT